MPLFRALAKNMAPMTNADESPTNRLTLFPIYLSLFIASTLWYQAIFTRNKFTGAGICLFIPSTYLLYVVQLYWIFHGIWKPARKGILFII